MRVRFLIPAVITALLVALGAFPVSAAPRGTLAPAEGGDFTFTYSTSDPHPANWIGLYRSSGGGPVDEEYVAPSLLWEYAPEAEGSVRLSADSLEPGSYTAFFLARDGYEWLAEPVEVRLSADGPVSFPVQAATLHNAGGVPAPLQDSLTILAAGGTDPAAVARGYEAFRELLATMHEQRGKRLLTGGFTPEQAQAISDLHTPNFM